MMEISKRFAASGMISLTSTMPQFDLAESVGPDLRLSEILSIEDYYHLADQRLGYGTAAGNEDLRKLIAQRHQVEPEDVVVTVGGMHGLFLLAQILAGVQSRILLVQPSFPLAASAMKLDAGSCSEVNTTFEQGYTLDPQRIGEDLMPDTRLVCLASPQNPSGVSVSVDIIRDLLQQMEKICPSAFLLVDETYREAVYSGQVALPSMIGLDPRIIVCASLSKCHGAPGLRTGWVITRSAQLREQLIQGKFQSVIANSMLDEMLALRVLQQADSLITARAERLAKGLALVDEWARFNEEKIEWVKPDAGALCCAALRPSCYPDVAVDDFYHRLASYSVRLAPGDWFGESQRVFRIGFGFLSLADTQIALERVTNAL